MDSSNTLDRTDAAHELKKDHFIPFLEGRPNRDSAINTEDLLNLKIALNTAKSLDDFLSLV